MAPYEHTSLPPPEAVRHTQWAPILISERLIDTDSAPQLEFSTITLLASNDINVPCSLVPHSFVFQTAVIFANNLTIYS